MRKILPVLAVAVLCQAFLPGCPAAESGSVYRTIGPFEVLGDAPHALEAGVGVFNSFNKDKQSEAARIELRIGRKFAFVGPAAGLIAGSEGERFGYAGIYADLVCGKFTVTPLLAIGAYRQGDGIDLGGTFQFRESLELAFQVAERWEAGFLIAHISNAGLHGKKPRAAGSLCNLRVPILADAATESRRQTRWMCPSGLVEKKGIFAPAGALGSLHSASVRYHTRMCTDALDRAGTPIRSAHLSAFSIRSASWHALCSSWPADKAMTGASDERLHRLPRRQCRREERSHRQPA